MRTRYPMKWKVFRVHWRTRRLREKLRNAIYEIDPFDTPVMAAIRRRHNVKNRIFDWGSVEQSTAIGPPVRGR